MKNKKRILTLFLSMLAMITMMITTVQAEDVDEDVKEARKGVLQIILEYEDKDGNKGAVGGGSAFLINEDTILTAYHVVHVEESSENYDYAVEKFGADFDKDKVKIKVVVQSDVTLEAKIINQSSTMDFAILELESPILGRMPLPLAREESISETMKIYALGFPDSVTGFQNQNTYTYQDVTIADGRITKSNESDGVKYVQHSATLTSGYSGGPLVTETGTVIAVNRGYLIENNYSVAIGQIRDVLDALGIVYIDAENGTVPTPTTGSSENVTDETGEEETTEEEETETRRKPVIDDDNDTDNIDSDDGEDEEEGPNTTLIIAIAAVAVVVIIVIIVLIVTLGKGKKNNRGNGSGVQGTMPPAMTPPPMTPPRQGNAPGNYFGDSDGAGATTVLNDGAGATTVLGASAQGMSIIRVKNNERIVINSPEFTIGKERRRVNYCVSDNNSISRVHAKLVNRGGQLFLIDMNATNGTFVNGTKLSPGQEVRLSAGDKFKLADEEFQVQG